MTPKEKAEYLVNKMYSKMPAKVIPTASTCVGQLSCDIDLNGYFENAKLCALIAINEIFDIAYWQLYESGGEQEEKYWQEVKQHIQQL